MNGISPEEQYKRSLARIFRILPASSRSTHREIVGLGCLIDDKHLVTCAHVVAQALHNTDECPMPRRDEVVALDFPGVKDVPDLSAHIVAWKPYKEDSHKGEIDDIAVLRLTNESIAIVESTKIRPVPADIIECAWLKGHPFKAYGYPVSYKQDGCYAYGKIQDRKFNQRYQIQGFEQEGGAKVQPGFSGSPVFDTEVNGIVGIIVQSAPYDKTATIIPVELLAVVWSGLKKVTRKVQCAPATKIIFGPLTPQENPNFTGREAFLGALREQLISGAGSAWKQVITGTGGVGKTQLAVKYAYSYQKEYLVIWWMRAEEPATLASDFAELADELGAAAIGLPESQMTNQAAKILKIQNWLDNNSDWLLVFDNAQQPEDVIRYLPHANRGHVVITTRTQNWEGVAGSETKLNVFDCDEAVRFITERTDQSDKKIAKTLAKELGCLPLALEQAVSYIKNRHKSINEYLSLFREHRSALFKREHPLDYRDTVATTWDVSFQQAQHEQKSTWHLLALFSCLAPDNIPRQLFRYDVSLQVEGQSFLTDELEFEDTLATLQKYSLVSSTKDAVFIHSLVQLIVRDQLSSDDAQTRAEVDAQLLHKAFHFDTDDTKTWPTCAALMPHIIQIRKCAENIGIASETLAALFTEAGSYLSVQADYIAARSFHKAALDIRKANYGDKHPDVAVSLNNLGNVFANLGQYTQAKECYHQAYTIRKRIHGDKHPDVAASLNGCGLALWNLGDYPQAKKCLEQSIATYEAVYGPHIATALNNLGLVFDSLSEFAKATACHMQALAIRRRVYGDKHQEIGMSLNNLADVLIKLGQYSQAKTKLEEALSIYKAVYGDEHPYVAIILNHIGGVFMKLHDYPQAREKLEESVAISVAVFGYKHSQVAISLSNLGVTLSYLGEIDQAKEKLEESVAICIDVLGPEHPTTIGLVKIYREFLARFVNTTAS